ncbi:MAG TPA: arsenite methyltransferase [Myxococcaceae bacterium]|nr:arsenite methyltransferase [Myxococcaceae bacterium]
MTDERSLVQGEPVVLEHFRKVAERVGNAGLGTHSSLKLGYSADDLGAVPEGADMGIGCGNPHAIAALQPGEVVLDLGSGGGFDCFLAAKKVGPTGRAIGVDMTAEMVALACHNAARSGIANVDFRLGKIEHLPLQDSSVDVILSNCVVNLSGDKAAVFREAFRVLKPGGRLAISDVVATSPVPEGLASGVLAVCAHGAARVDLLLSLLRDAGFKEPLVQVKEQSRAVIAEWLPGSGIERYLASANIQATKPKAHTLGRTQA